MTYENLDGEEFTQNISLGVIDVQEQVYADLIEVKEDTQKTVFTDEVKLAVVISVIVIIAAIIIIRRRIRIKKIEKEF